MRIPSLKWPLTGFLAVAALVWYLAFNRHVMLLEQEQNQMFRFATDYFYGFIGRPGGLTQYAANFLVQFFCFPIIGGLIATGLLLAIALLFGKILKQFEVNPALRDFLAVIPSLLLMQSGRELNIVAHEIALICAMGGFLLFTTLMASRLRWWLLAPFIVVLYLTAAGNTLITAVLIALYAFRCRQSRWYAGAVACVVTPFLFHRIFLTTPMRNIYLALTPFVELTPLLSWKAVWIAVAALPAPVAIIPKLKTGPLAGCVFGVILLCGVAVWDIFSYSRNAELLNRMVFRATAADWQGVLNAGKRLDNSPYKCFYTNLALQQTGQMPDSMFHYDQIGTEGLIPRNGNYYVSYILSEFYYRLGMVNEIHHYTMDAIVSIDALKEASARCFVRLKECAMLWPNYDLVTKYESLMSSTLFYRNRVQRPEIQPVITENFLLGRHEEMLEQVLKACPTHKMAFEYLMAYYMIKLDYENAKKCFDTYYAGMNYPQLPIHYAEFLTLYGHLNKLGADFFAQYSVPRAVREQFGIMDQLITRFRRAATEENFKLLESRFGKTYWFNVIFPLTDTKTDYEAEENIY